MQEKNSKSKLISIKKPLEKSKQNEDNPKLFGDTLYYNDGTIVLDIRKRKKNIK